MSQPHDASAGPVEPSSPRAPKSTRRPYKYYFTKARDGDRVWNDDETLVWVPGRTIKRRPKHGGKATVIRTIKGHWGKFEWRGAAGRPNKFFKAPAILLRWTRDKTAIQLRENCDGRAIQLRHNCDTTAENLRYNCDMDDRPPLRLARCLWGRGKCTQNCGKCTRHRGNLRGICENVRDIANNVRNIAHNARNIAQNVRNIAHNVRSIANNVRDIANNLRNITHNVRDIAHNARSVAYV